MTAFAYHLDPLRGTNGLSVRPQPLPEPGPGQVVVRVRAASLNRRDLMLMDGTYPVPAAPGVVPLSDGTGEVISAGAGVTRVAIGDRVTSTYYLHWTDGPQRMATAREQHGASHDGWLASYILLDAESVVPVPEHLTDPEAASLTCAGLAAARSVACGAFNARVTLVGAFPATTPVSDPFGGRYLSIQRIATGSRADLEAMNRAISVHTNRPVIDRVSAFDEAPVAYKHFRDGNPFGKVVIGLP